MRSWSVALGTLVVCAMLGPRVVAGPVFTVVSQHREVDAAADATAEFNIPQSQTNSMTAPDDAPFNGSADANVSSGSGDAISAGIANATQDSVLDPSSITVSGHAEGNAFNGTGTADASAHSSFQVTFDVSNPLDFMMSGNLLINQSPDAQTDAVVSIALTDSHGANVVNPVITNTLGGGSFDLSTPGSLQPGTYTLSVDATASGAEESANTAQFSVNLAPVGTTSVPIPPAACTAMMTLAGLAMIRLAARAKTAR